MSSGEGIAFVVPTFNGAAATRFELSTIMRNDPQAFDHPWFIVEDPCGDQRVADAYDELGKDYPVNVAHLDEWSNMHGAARKAFERAMRVCDPEWIVYLGDDLGITKGALSNLIHFVQNNKLDSIALVQPAYWNAHDLCSNRDDASAWEGPKIFWTKERDFFADVSVTDRNGLHWTDKVPRNPHWDGTGTEHEGIARPYINVNGAGFACRAETYRKVGGFAEGTWCLDETISVRVWLHSDQGVVCLPGPPMVHYFGRATLAGPPAHDLHTYERWTEAMEMTKEEADKLCRAKMAEREASILAETRAASYWKPQGGPSCQ